MASFEIVDLASQNDLDKFIRSLSPQTLHNFDHFNFDGRYNTFFIYDKDDVIAYGFLRQATHQFKKHLCVLGMVVADSHQGKGVGTFLGQKMIEWARKKYSKIALGVYSDNIGALRFYKRLGFDVEGILRKEELRKDNYRDIVTMAMYL